MDNATHNIYYHIDTLGEWYLIIYDDWNVGNYSFVVEDGGLHNDSGSGGDAADNLSSATPISVGIKYSGYLIEDDDTHDYYKVSLEADHFYYINSSGPSIYTDLYLYDPFQNIIDSSTSSSSISHNIICFANASGGWYIRISDMMNGGRYTLSVEDGGVQNDANSGGDAGENFLDALEISAGMMYNAGIVANEEDWYKFQATTGQGLDLTFTNKGGAVNEEIQGWLYHPQNHSLDYDPAQNNETVHLLESVQSNGWYRIRFFASSDILYSFKITIYNAPVPLTLYSPTGITNNSMNISWSQYDNPSNFRAYDVYKSTSPGSKYIEQYIYNVSTTSYTFTDLSYSTSYYFYLRIRTTNYAFAYSSQVTGTTKPSYDPYSDVKKVTLYAPDYISSDSMTLKWVKYGWPDFSRYEIYQSEITGFTPSADTKIKSFEHPGTTSFVVPNLMANTSYYYILRVINIDGDALDSEQISGMTLPASEYPPDAVQLNQPTDITSYSMNLSWSTNTNSDFLKCELHMHTAAFTPSADTLETTFYFNTQTSHRVYGLEGDTLYFFIVRVFDEYMQYSDSNQLSERTLYVNKPPQPIELWGISDFSDNYIRIEWLGTQDKDFAKYEIHMSETKNFNPSNSTLKMTITDIDKTTYLATAVELSTKYYFLIRAVDSEGLYSDSNYVSATTLAENQPPDPVNINIPTEVTAISAKVSWYINEQPDFAKYELHRSVTPDFQISTDSFVKIFPLPSDTTYILDGLDPSTTYYLKIRAYDTYKLYSDSTQVSFRTLSPPNIKINLSSPINIKSTSMKLSWEVNNMENVALYVIHVSTQPSFIIRDENKFTELSLNFINNYTLIGLKFDTPYYIKLRVYDITGSITDSKQVSARTYKVSGDDEFQPVVLYVPGEITKSSCQLVWDESINLNFKRYEVHMSESVGFDPSSVTMITTITDKTLTSYRIVNLKSDAQYYFIVRVCNDNDEYKDSAQVSLNTLPASANPPTKPMIDRPTFTKDPITGADVFILKWLESTASNFLKYEVHESAQTGFLPTKHTLIATLFSSTNSTVTIPLKEQNKHYKVRSYNRYWLYTDSDEVTVYPNNVLLAENYLRTSEMISIEWTENSDADFDHYEVHMSSSPDFDPVDSTLVMEIENRTENSYQKTQLKSRTTYYFKIIVVNKVGLKITSNEITTETAKASSDDLLEIFGIGLGMFDILGVVVSIISFIVGLLLLTRKKRRFRRYEKELSDNDDLDELEELFSTKIKADIKSDKITPSHAVLIKDLMDERRNELRVDTRNEEQDLPPEDFTSRYIIAGCCTDKMQS